MTYPPWLMTIVLMVTVKGTMVVKHISNKSFPTLQTLHHSMGRRSRTSEAKSKRRHPYISASSSRTVSSRWQHLFLIHFIYIPYIFLTYFLYISYLVLIYFSYISYTGWFLSDPGVPGVRSMGPVVSHSLTESKTFVKLNWVDSGWWRYQLNTNW